jgi:hypothetical protein
LVAFFIVILLIEICDLKKNRSVIHI